MSCSTDNSDNDELTEYGYKLNYEITTGNYAGTYHRVTEYHCYETEKNAYYVKSYKMHYFSINNPSYTNLTGSQVSSIVRNNSRTPDSKFFSSRTSATTATITNSVTGEVKTFNLPEGIKYEVLYYY